MTEAKRSIWTRLKHLFLGKPVSYEEYRAAQHRPTGDTMSQVQGGIRNVNAGPHL